MVKTEDVEKKEEIVPVNNPVEEKVTPTSNLEVANDTQVNTPISAPVDNEQSNTVSV